MTKLLFVIGLLLNSIIDCSAEVGPLPGPTLTSFKACFAQELAKIEVVASYSVTEPINCDKAKLPACETVHNDVSVTYSAAQFHSILSATSSSVKANHAREVNIGPATISPDKKAASANLHCDGWGCDPNKGGSPGTGTVSGSEQRNALRYEIDNVARICADKTGGDTWP